MEKYAVACDDTKTASRGCPICGAELEEHGEVRLCPKHGTKGTEAARRDEEEQGGERR